MIKQLKTALILLGLLTVLTGIIYPLLVTLIAHLFFPWQANGSIVMQNNKMIGSALIGQHFNSPEYFWGRPSATSPFPYNAANSSGSNSGPSNPDFLATVKNRVIELRAHHTQALIPVDLVTASGSGLDPDMSPLAALYQVTRIAKARNINEQEVINLINKLTIKRSWLILGEPRVNVLELNLTLDTLRKAHGR